MKKFLFIIVVFLMAACSSNNDDVVSNTETDQRFGSGVYNYGSTTFQIVDVTDNTFELKCENARFDSYIIILNIDGLDYGYLYFEGREKATISFDFDKIYINGVYPGSITPTDIDLEL